MVSDHYHSRQYARDAAFGEGHADPKEKALTLVLEVWAAWMRDGKLVDGYPEQAVGFDPATSTDFEEMGAAVDLRVAMAVDAAIGDLPHNERMVLAAVWGSSQASVWRFREPHEVIYARAREMLIVVLARRGVLGD
jgi:hypothetical protein